MISTIELGFKEKSIKEAILMVEKNIKSFSLKIEYLVSLDERNYLKLRSQASLAAEKLFSSKAISKLIKCNYS